MLTNCTCHLKVDDQKEPDRVDCRTNASQGGFPISTTGRASGPVQHALLHVLAGMGYEGWLGLRGINCPGMHPLVGIHDRLGTAPSGNGPKSDRPKCGWG